MAETIRGLNVQIGAETTGLSKALADVNKQSRDIANELKQVERGLKFNPKNTELLAQKQKLLGDQVAATRDKLDRLRGVQGQINDQFKKGEISEGKYRAFQREVVEAESKLKYFEDRLKSTQDRSKEFADRMGDVSEKLQKAGKAFAPVSAAAGAVSAGLVGLAVNAGRVADDLNTMAKTSKLSTETLQKFKYASDLVDVSTETLTKSMSRLVRSMGDARRGSKEQEEAFKKLGVAVKDDVTGNLRNSEAVFNDVIKALSEMESEADRDYYAMKLMGQGAKDLNPIIEDGGEQLRKLGDEAKRAGLIMSQETLDSMNELNDEIDTLKATAGATFAQLGATIGEALLPALKSMAERLKGALSWLKDLDEGTLKTITTVGGLVAAITPLAMLAAKVATAFKVLSPVIMGLASPVGLAVTAFGGLAAAIGWAAGAEDRAIRKTKEAIKTYEGQVNSVTDLIAEYEQLSEKTNKTNKEKERMIELSNTIADVIPGAVKAYDEEGNALLDLNLALVQTVNLKREEMALRAKDLDQQIKQAAERKKIAEDEKKRLEETWETMQKRWDLWGPPEQERLNELTAEYNQEMAKANAELGKSTRELNDLRTEQQELEKMSKKITVEYVQDQIKKRREARATAQAQKEEETSQTETAASESEKRILLWNEEARKRNEINRLAREAEIRQDEEAATKIQQVLDKRTAYEEAWNQRMLQMRDQYNLSQAASEEEAFAIRMQQLQKQRDAEIKNADKLGADKQAILDYYATKEKELLDEKDEAYRQSFINTSDAMSSFFQSVAEGEKSFKDAMKGMIVSSISALQQQVIAEQAAGVAIAAAKAPATFGASLAWIGQIASKVGPALAAFEATKAAVARLEIGGKVVAPTMALIGEGRHDEAVLPLNDKVFSELGQNIAAHLPQPAGASGRPVNINFHGVLIGDELSFKKLARKILPYQINEQRRMGD